MTIRLIGLTGPIGVGKDTVAAMLVKALHNASFWADSLAFADPVKEIRQTAFNLPVDWLKDDFKNLPIPGHGGVTPRDADRKIGTDFFVDTYGPDFWIKHLAARRKRLTADDPNVFTIVRDVRNVADDAEAKWIRSEGGVVIHISGPQRRAQLSVHRSDTQVKFEGGDITLNNDRPLHELETAVEVLVQRFTGEGR